MKPPTSPPESSRTAAVERLTQLRRRDSEVKVARVLAAAAALARAGSPLTISNVARTAAVSRRFIYDHPELQAAIALYSAQALQRFSGRIEAAAQTTALTQRVELENLKAVNHKQRQHVTTLERRLSRALGEEVTAELAPDAHIETLQQQLRDLRGRLATSQADHRRATEELDAVRHLNRDLMSQLNASG